MAPQIESVPDSRAAEVRALIERAQRDAEVPLIPLTAIELCVLGAPEHPYVDASIARAWAGLRPRVQQATVDKFTDVLAGRGVLAQTDARAYSLSPELGVILAARCRPAFIITNEIPGFTPPQPVLFGLGDEEDPAQAVVAEVPAGRTDGDSRHGPPEPLRTVFGYFLYSLGNAADFLARWTINPPQVPGAKPGTPRIVTLVHPRDEHGRIGFRLGVRGNGMTARVDAGDSTSVSGSGLQPRRAAGCHACHDHTDAGWTLTDRCGSRTTKKPTPLSTWRS